MSLEHSWSRRPHATNLFLYIFAILRVSLSTVKVVESRAFDIIHLDWNETTANIWSYYWPCRFFGSVMIALECQPDFRTAVNFEKNLDGVEVYHIIIDRRFS